MCRLQSCHISINAGGMDYRAHATERAYAHDWADFMGRTLSIVRYAFAFRASVGFAASLLGKPVVPTQADQNAIFSKVRQVQQRFRLANRAILLDVALLSRVAPESPLASHRIWGLRRIVDHSTSKVDTPQIGAAEVSSIKGCPGKTRAGKIGVYPISFVEIGATEVGGHKT
jgi:hypothetical protein